MIIPLELQAARIRLAKERPYLATAAWALQPVLKTGLRTLAVDMYWRLYYDPAVLMQWPAEVTAGALYHELCHLLRNHPERMKGFMPRLSNIATDAEINDDLLREQVKFPAQPVTPEWIGQPEDLLAEEYYDALVTGDRTEDFREHTHSGSGRCGSCATGQMEPWENKPPCKGSSSGLSLTEGEIIRRDVARKIKEQSGGQGSVPGHWLRWADEKLRPQVDWRRQLAAAVRFAVTDTAGAADYSYRRPSRRQGQLRTGDVLFPSLVCPIPSVAVVADTSGSISKKMLARALAELAAILKSVGQREGIQVLAVDQTVGFCRRVFRPEQVQLAGGGGTDMRVGLAAAAKLKPFPQLGIVITDGYTAWPDHPPQKMKVIVVLLGEGKAPAWARVIRVAV